LSWCCVRQMKYGLLARLPLITLLAINLVPLALAPSVSTAPGLTNTFSSNVTSGDAIQVTIGGCSCGVASVSDSRGTAFSEVGTSGQTYTFVGIPRSSGADVVKAIFSGGTPTDVRITISEKAGTTLVQSNSNSCPGTCPLFPVLGEVHHIDDSSGWNAETLLAVIGLFEESRLVLRLPWIPKPMLGRLRGRGMVAATNGVETE